MSEHRNACNLLVSPYHDRSARPYFCNFIASKAMANLVADTGVFCFCYGGVVHAHSRTWRQGQRSNGKHGTAISLGFFGGGKAALELAGVSVSAICSVRI